MGTGCPTSLPALKWIAHRIPAMLMTFTQAAPIVIAGSSVDVNIHGTARV